jgi:hypothetical protein
MVGGAIGSNGCIPERDVGAQPVGSGPVEAGSATFGTDDDVLDPDTEVRVGDLPERGEVAREAGQALEVCGRRHEESVEAGCLEPLEQALAAERQLGGEVRVRG